MELIQIIKFYKKYSWKILLVSCLFLLIGVGVYFLPHGYIATGSFVVLRNTNPIGDDFSYEGYYAQLTSQDFSKNLISFFRNESILLKISKDLGIDQNTLKRKIRVAKEAPSVSRLEVRHSSSDMAESIWLSLRDEILSLVDRINQETDTGMKVIVIGDSPVLKQPYSNILGYGIGGLMVGFMFSSLYFGFREYQR